MPELPRLNDLVVLAIDEANRKLMWNRVFQIPHPWITQAQIKQIARRKQLLPSLGISIEPPHAGITHERAVRVEAYEVPVLLERFAQIALEMLSGSLRA